MSLLANTEKQSTSSFSESLGLLGASTVDHVCERARQVEVSFFLEYKKEKKRKKTDPSKRSATR